MNPTGTIPTIALAALAATAFAAPPPGSVPFPPEKAAALRAEWAKHLGAPEEVANSIGMKLALIPPGRFTMGPNGSTRRVTLEKPYYIGVCEVTLGEYRKFKPGHKIDGAADEFNADDRPAAMVSWNDARAYCRWISEQPDEKAAGRLYALPTEAQWEWAARAGTATAAYHPDTKDPKVQAEYAWFNSTYTQNPKSESAGRGRQPVGKLKPNAFGLYDMLGNVWEWCDDRRGDAETGETRDPVMRGGSWRSGGFHCSAVVHDPGSPDQRGDNIGFRVVCRVVSAK